MKRVAQGMRAWADLRGIESRTLKTHWTWGCVRLKLAPSWESYDVMRATIRKDVLHDENMFSFTHETVWKAVYKIRKKNKSVLGGCECKKSHDKRASGTLLFGRPRQKIWGTINQFPESYKLWKNSQISCAVSFVRQFTVLEHKKITYHPRDNIEILLCREQCIHLVFNCCYSSVSAFFYMYAV